MNKRSKKRVNISARPAKVKPLQQRLRLARLVVIKVWCMAIVLGAFGVASSRALKFIDKGLSSADIYVLLATLSIGVLAVLVIMLYIIPQQEKLT